MGNEVNVPMTSGGRVSFRSRVAAVSRTRTRRETEGPHLGRLSDTGAFEDDCISRSKSSRALLMEQPKKPQAPPTAWVDVESLADEDIANVDPGLHPVPSEDTDPPWSDLMNCISTSPSTLPYVHNGPFEANLFPKISRPLSPAELYQNLLYIRSLDPPPPYRNILNYHAQFRSHHSTRSFNLLIALGIRLSYFGTVRMLLGRMQAEGIRPDTFTRQLSVRNMILSGEGWDAAWKEQISQSRDEGISMPLPVWLEFFGTERTVESARPGRGPQDLVRHLRDPGMTEPISLHTVQMRYRTLMQHMPSVSAREWAVVPAWAVHRVIRGLIRTDQRPMAIDITRFFFEGLPETLTERWQTICRQMIREHMFPRRAPPLVEYGRLRKEVLAFFDLRPDLCPDSAILFGLMRPLKKSDRCGKLASTLVDYFVNRWGVGVVDEQVRRRLASLAIKQKKLGVAKRVIRSQASVEAVRRELRAEADVKDSLQASSLGGVSEALRFARRGLEGWKWRLLRRRLWRVRSKGVLGHGATRRVDVR